MKRCSRTGSCTPAFAAVPVKVGTFLEEFREIDVRQAKAILQGIIKAAHVLNDGRIGLEFRS